MDADKLYSFGFRSLLAEEALDACGRKSPILKTFADANIAQATSLEMIDEVFVGPASEMATVYTAITAFENSVRRQSRCWKLSALAGGKQSFRPRKKACCFAESGRGKDTLARAARRRPDRIYGFQRSFQHHCNQLGGL
jgi:hypothetical protein